MIKNSAHKKGNLGIFILSIMLIVFIVLIGAVSYILFKTQKNTKKDEKVVVADTVALIDTSQWKVYPTEESYTGWSIKHPIENTPLATEKDTRVSISHGEKESILITIDRESKSTQGTLENDLNNYKNKDLCMVKTNLAKISLNDYEAYKFTSDCDTNPEYDNIFFKDKTTYIVVSPYAQGDYVIIEVYTDKELANASEIDLANKIIDTINFIKPEETLDTGFLKFSDSSVGYSLVYPKSYRVEENTAWKNASLILYAGGQVYDLVVQVWNSEAEYKAYFQENIGLTSKVVVHKVKGRYVTLFNYAESAEVEQIINSFKLED